MRKLAQKEAEDERKKKHIKEEYQREKVNSRYQYRPKGKTSMEKKNVFFWALPE